MATTLEIMGIDNGLLVSLMTVGSNSQVDALTAAGYRAETGALVWQRQIAQHISYGNPPDQLFGGTLYVELAPAWTVLAIDARTGKQLWKYFWQPIEQKVFTVSVYPLTAGDGVVVFAGATGPSLDQLKANFRALRQSDGALVWRKEVSKPGGFQGGLGSPIQTDGNLLYFATNVPEQNDLELNALQVSSGTLLWHQRIATRPTLNMLSLGLANGVLYAPYQFNAQRNTHGLVIQAVQAKSGTLLWQARLETSGALVALGDGMNASTMINATDSGRSYTSVVALNTANGTTFWHNAGEGFGGIIADGKVVAFVHRVHQGDFRQQLCALQPDTGTSLWCHDADGFNNWVIAAT
jgi:outer membrane protein assembly factor BamB